MRLINTRALLAIGLLFAAGCVMNPAPDLWLPTPAQSQVEGYGGWVAVSFVPKPTKRPAVGGELIAVSADRLYLLTNGGIAEVAKSEVAGAVVAGYEQDVRPITRGWIAGAVSTITQGVFALPGNALWAAAATSARREAWSYARVSYPDQQWQDLRRYARFPQGLPAGVDLHALLAKPQPAPPAPPHR